MELDPHGSQDDGHKLPAKNIRSVGKEGIRDPGHSQDLMNFLNAGSKMWKALNLMALKLDQMYPYHRKN